MNIVVQLNSRVRQHYSLKTGVFIVIQFSSQLLRQSEQFSTQDFCSSVTQLPILGYNNTEVSAKEELQVNSYIRTNSSAFKNYFCSISKTLKYNSQVVILFIRYTTYDTGLQ